MVKPSNKGGANASVKISVVADQNVPAAKSKVTFNIAGKRHEIEVSKKALCHKHAQFSTFQKEFNSAVLQEYRAIALLDSYPSSVSRSITTTPIATDRSNSSTMASTMEEDESENSGSESQSNERVP